MIISMKNNNLISIIIPIFNAEMDLPTLIESLKKQTDSNFEVLFVDDKSKDNSLKLLTKEKLKIGKSVRVLQNKINLGPAKTRNFGILKSTGKIIAFTDSDCIINENWVRNIRHFFKNDSSELVMGKVTIPKSTLIGDSISALGFPAGANLGFEKVWKVSKEGFTEHISSCNFAAKNEVFKRIGTFDEDFRVAGGEDTELSIRAINQKLHIKYCPEISVLHKPRKSIISFIKWQIVRGRGNYYIKKKLKNVNSLVKTKIWYIKNVIKTYWKSPKIFLILTFLFGGFVLQQIGYILEFIKNESGPHE